MTDSLAAPAPNLSAMHRVHRFRPRLTRRRLIAAASAHVASALSAAAFWTLVAAGQMGPAIAGLGTLVVLGAGALAAHGIRGGFEGLREPREYRQALSRLRAGDRAGALESVGRAIEREPEAFSPYTLQGLLLSEAGDYKGSLEAYAKAIARKPGSWIGHSGAGAALLNLGRLAESVEALGRSLALGTTWPVPRYQLGLALFLRGEYAGAAEAFAEALALGLDAPNVELIARSLRLWALERTGAADAARQEKARIEPLRSLPEIEVYRDRLKGANLSPVGRLAAWAVGADESKDPPRL